MKKLLLITVLLTSFANAQFEHKSFQDPMTDEVTEYDVIGDIGQELNYGYGAVAPITFNLFCNSNGNFTITVEVHNTFPVGVKEETVEMRLISKENGEDIPINLKPYGERGFFYFMNVPKSEVNKFGNTEFRVRFSDNGRQTWFGKFDIPHMFESRVFRRCGVK